MGRPSPYLPDSDDKAYAGFGIFRAACKTVQRENFLRNGKTEAVPAGAVSRLITAVEHLEQTGQFAFRNGFAVVFDCEERSAAAAQRNGHAPVFG